MHNNTNKSSKTVGKNVANNFSLFDAFLDSPSVVLTNADEIMELRENIKPFSTLTFHTIRFNEILLI